MKVYFLSRWGNGSEDDGPNSSNDTHIIIRADNLERASEIADSLLLRLPESTTNGMKVKMFTQNAVLIGISENTKEKEEVICSPWCSFSPPQNCSSAWARDSLVEGWQTHENYYGE